jgi:Glycosyl hydrolases family 16
MSDDNGMCRRPANVETSSAGLRLKTLAASPDCRSNIKWSTGSIRGKAAYRYGFFEATMKIADIKGMNNAFWMNTGNQSATGDYFEIDGTPVAAVTTNNSVNAAAGIMFSSALIYAGIPEHPQGHDMTVKSLRVYALQ